MSAVRGHGRAVLAAALLTVAALVLVQVFLLRMFQVPSTSMEPTLQPGDRVAVSLLAPGPAPLRRGDVVVFRDALGWSEGDDGGRIVKRVVGLPGDTVQWRPGWDRLRVNGAPVDEPYLGGGPAGAGEAFEVTVPPGRLWVLGDHRATSQDSRQHRSGPGAGFVSQDDVIGRVEAVVWPLDRVQGVRS